MRKLTVLFVLVLAFILSGCSMLDKLTQTNYKSSSEYANTISKSGLGYSIDVVTASYIDTSAIKRSTPVFNENELAKLSLFQTDTLENKIESFSETTIQAITSKINQSYYGSVTVSKGIGVFTSSITTNFSLDKTVSSSTKKHSYYYMIYQNVAAKTLELPGYGNLEQYTDILSDTFLADLEKLKNDTITPAQFVAKYGTHVIMAGIYGGKIEAYYSVYSNADTTSEQFKTTIDGKVNAGFRNVLGGSVSGGTSLDVDVKTSFSDAVTNFKVQSVGGSVLSASTFDSFASVYPTWAQGFNNSDVNTDVLIGIPDNGLVAIWDLFPNQYADEKAKIETYFTGYANGTYNEFIQKYCSTEFSQGTGTKADPYIITTQDEFTKMGNDSYFKLGNDLVLENYTPFNFSGSFDGDDHTISGINYTYSTSSVTEDINIGGLFNTITGGSEVKNLKLSGNFKINPVSSGSGTIFGGLLTGNNDGTISNVTIQDSNLELYRENASLGTIAGYNNGIIDNCDVFNTSLAGYSNIGGITASNTNKGEVKNCKVENVNLNYIYTFVSQSSGGIVGYNSGKVENCQVIKISLIASKLYYNSSFLVRPAIGYVIGYHEENAVMNNCTISEFSLEVTGFGPIEKIYICAKYDGKIGNNLGTVIVG